MYDLMTSSSVNMENKALQPDIVPESKKGKTALLIEMSVSSDFGLNNAEIKKTSKYQDLKNEIIIIFEDEGDPVIPRSLRRNAEL